MIEFIAKNQHGESMKNIVMATCLTTCLGFSLPAFSDDGAALSIHRVVALDAMVREVMHL